MNMGDLIAWKGCVQVMQEWLVRCEGSWFGGDCRCAEQ
jgi:hypothetical protein